MINPMIALIIVLNVASLLMCLFLLFFKLRTLDRVTQQRLFVKQVKHLSVADALFHWVYPCSVVLYFPPFGASKHLFRDKASATVLCHMVRTVEISASMASMLLEVHISLALTCQFFKWRKALPVLWRSVSFVWPMAFILGGAEIFCVRHIMTVDVETGVCVSDTNMPVYAPVILLTCVICISSNMLAAVGGLSHRTLQRASQAVAHGHVLSTELRDHFGMPGIDLDLSFTLGQPDVPYMDQLHSFVERFCEFADVLLSVQARILPEVQDIGWCCDRRRWFISFFIPCQFCDRVGCAIL